MSDAAPIASTSARPRPDWATVVCAFAVIVASGVLQVLHVRTYLDPAATSFCTVGETFDCNAVTLSRFV